MKRLHRYIRHIGSIVWKDLLTERRTKEIFPQMCGFAVLIVVVYNVTLQVGVSPDAILPGLLWIAITFAGILGLNHSFVIEREDECLQGMRLCPIDRSAIYLGKVCGNILFMLFTELLLLPLMIILFNLPVGRYLGRLGLVMLLGTFGFVVVGTLFAAMSANTRIREIMLPLLLFPVVIPLLIAATKSTGKILAQNPLSEIRSWLYFLLAFDFTFFGLALITCEYIIESE